MLTRTGAAQASIYSSPTFSLPKWARELLLGRRRAERTGEVDPYWKVGWQEMFLPLPTDCIFKNCDNQVIIINAGQVIIYQSSPILKNIDEN